jgi:hypothetical protein
MRIMGRATPKALNMNRPEWNSGLAKVKLGNSERVEYESKILIFHI